MDFDDDHEIDHFASEEEIDPGEALRDELAGIELPDILNDTAFDQLLYTADERGIIVDGVSREDITTIRKLIILAETLTPAELDRFRM